MFVFLFLFLFRQTKDKADQGDEYLAVFVQLELSDTSYFAELVERNRFLTDHIFEGVIRKEDISRGMFAFGNLLTELLQGVENVSSTEVDSIGRIGRYFSYRANSQYAPANRYTPGSRKG